MYPGLTHGAYACLHAHGTDEQKATYLPQAGQRRMDRHHVPDRAAVRHRPGPAAHQGRAAGRRHLQAHRPEDLHLAPASTTWPTTSCTWCWRACRMRRPAARASGCSSCRSSMVNADGSLGERNGIYCGALEHKMGIHGNATCQIDARRRRRHAGRPAQQGPGGDVRDDERRAPGRGQPVAGPDRSGLPERLAYAKDRIQMRSLSGPKATDKPADPIIVHPDVRKMLLTAKAYAEGGRALAIYCALLLDKEHCHPRRESAQGLRRNGGAAHAHRQGLPHRQRPDRHQRLHAGLRRPRLHQGMGHGAVRARRPHQHDLRGHQHHPVAGLAGPQGAGQQRRHAAASSASWSASWWRKKASTRRWPSSSTRWPTWATR